MKITQLKVYFLCSFLPSFLQYISHCSFVPSFFWTYCHPLLLMLWQVNCPVLVAIYHPPMHHWLEAFGKSSNSHWTIGSPDNHSAALIQKFLFWKVVWILIVSPLLMLVLIFFPFPFEKSSPFSFFFTFLLFSILYFSICSLFSTLLQSLSLFFFLFCMQISDFKFELWD